MLKISLRPSRLLAGILTLAHAAAIAVVLVVGIPLWMKLLATAVLLANLAYVIRQHVLLLAPHSALAIEIGSDNNFSLQTRSSGWADYEILSSTYVMPFLTVLNLRETDSRAVKRVSLLPDSLHAEDFRRLRVWLRWKQDDRAR